MDVAEADFGPANREAVARAIHTHPGPEVFYLLTGQQCLETPTGATKARAGEGMTAPANTPMQLNIVGQSSAMFSSSSSMMLLNHESMFLTGSPAACAGNKQESAQNH